MDGIDIPIPTDMGDAAMLAIIVGFLSPLVLNFIVKATWSSAVKALVAFAWSAVIGTLTALVAGAFEGLSIVSTILLVFVVAIATYRNFWKEVAPNMQRGIEEKRALEEKVVVQEQNKVASAAAAKVIQSGAIEKAVADDLAKPVVPTSTVKPPPEGTAY